MNPNARYSLGDRVKVRHSGSFRGKDIFVEEDMVIIGAKINASPGDKYDTVYRTVYLVGRTMFSTTEWVGEEAILMKTGTWERT